MLGRERPILCYDMHSSTTSPTSADIQPFQRRHSSLDSPSSSSSFHQPFPLPTPSSSSATSTSSKPSRHVCPDCGRSYKAAETLNRHRKNHSDTTQYVCRVCHASFKRKDLLDRHSQIHIQNSANASRNRSHRACARCSRLKTRCDNLKPCSRCARGGYACTYAENRSRARTDRSATASPTRTASSASSTNVVLRATTTDHVSAGMPTGASTTIDDTTNAWDGDKTWAESLWTQTYPWFSQLSHPQGNASPGAIDTMFNMTANVYDTNDPSHTFDSTTPEDATAPVPTHGAFVDDSSIQNMSWSPWERYQATSGNACTTFDGQFTAWPPTASDPSPETAVRSAFNDPSQRPIMSHGDASKAMQQHLAAELAQLALGLPDSHAFPDDRSIFWLRTAQRVESVFDLYESAQDGVHIFKHFIYLYMRHVHSRLPLRYYGDLNPDTLPPHLYLTMVAIGAPYAGKKGISFHLHLMEALRPQIILLATQKSLSDDDVYSLVETLLIVQAAAVLFGNRRAFDFAPQISTIVMALGRRVHLFDDPDVSLSTAQVYKVPNNNQVRDRSQSWVIIETRRRLAIGFLRLEAYVSLLLGTRLRISHDELHVRCPIRDHIWRGEGSGGEMAIRTAVLDEPAHIFSGLMRTALDPDKDLPPLRFDELQLIMFGLQSNVWRLSQDPGMARRYPADLESTPGQFSFERNSGDDSHSAADRFRDEYARTTHALKKWKAALASWAPATLLPEERNIILASELLFNVSFMKLRVDLPGLHRVALSCIRDEPAPRETLIEVYRWATTKGAYAVVESACSTWTLITKELRRPTMIRANFNLLAQIGLLHAAVTVWVYAGVRVNPGSATMSLDMYGSSDASQAEGAPEQPYVDLRLCRTNNRTIMQSFATLLKDVQPAYGTGYASYHNTVEALARRPLPPL